MEPNTTSERVSASWLREQLDDIRASLQVLTLQATPAPFLVYKPQAQGGGRALRIDVNLRPQFKGRFVRAAGAVFLELAPQRSERDAQGNATFDWDNPMKAKLGLPDLTNILWAIRCRILRIPVSAKDPAAVNLFHKYTDGDGESSTVIKYELQKNSAILSVSKSKTERASISLTLQEELALELYLQHALQWAMFTGKR